jgi:tRNA 5-methylaminomethyl-2-thiouridine biosynthesis bifunctional protein
MQRAHITWQDNQPTSQDYTDVYYSAAGGRAEKEYVFLKHNQLPQRWKNSSRFVIGETGFGTGLSFLVTADAWLASSLPDACLYYFSVEKHPLSRSDLQRAINCWPEYSELARQLLSVWPESVPGFHSIEIMPKRIVLCLMLGDVMEMLPAMTTKVDAWYLDGFSPQRNPAMWSQDVLNCIARQSHSDTTFSTYTAASDVRQGLVAAGFAVQKVAGFSSKRNMLCGKIQQLQPVQHSAPWVTEIPHTIQETRAAVIGAGLAGITTACALAQRGWQVDVFESHADYAQGGSGNPAGVLLPRIASNSSVESEFYATAFFRTLRHLTGLQQNYPDLEWTESGVIQLLSSERLQKQFSQVEPDNNYVRKLFASDASAIAGIELEVDALFYPQAGWLNPRSWCDVLLRDAGDKVRTRFNAGITRLVQQHALWQLIGDNNNVLGSYPVVVMANAHQINSFSQTAWLDVHPARGQLSYVAATNNSQHLQCPICYEGYILPAINRRHIIGASFVADNDSDDCTAAEHRQNLDRLLQYLPTVGIAADDYSDATCAGRAAVRAVTPDRMPLLGAVPDRDYFQQHYSDLQLGKRTTMYPVGRSLAGLYVNVGHGARGFTSTSLAAATLAALITQDVLPVSLPVLQALHPARFFIRQSRKGKLTAL